MKEALLELIQLVREQKYETMLLYHEPFLDVTMERVVQFISTHVRIALPGVRWFIGDDVWHRCDAAAWLKIGMDPDASPDSEPGPWEALKRARPLLPVYTVDLT